MEQENMKGDNSQHKDEKDIEIIHDSISYPLNAPPSHEQEAVISPNTNSDRSSWDENLSDLNNDDEEAQQEDDDQRENDRDLVSDQTLSEKDEGDDDEDGEDDEDDNQENDENFEEEYQQLTPSGDQVQPQSPRALIQHNFDGQQHQETSKGGQSENRNPCISAQLPLVDSPISTKDAQTNSSLHTSIVSASLGNTHHDESKTNSKKHSAQKTKQKTHPVIHSHVSRNASQFPESYDVAASFLKKLLNSYYLQKLHSKKSTQEVKSIGVSVGQQSEDRGIQHKQNIDNLQSGSSQGNADQSEKSLKKIKSKKNRKGVAFSAFLLAFLCILSSCFMNELFKMQEELNLKNAQLSESLQLNADFVEKNRQLELKNGMLKKLAEKAVEEEKRNCDFFDIFSILKSTLGSKRQHNIQELCSHYQRYQQLEAHLTQIIEKQSEDNGDISKESPSNPQDSISDQVDSLIPQEHKCEAESCASKKSMFQKVLGVIGAVGKLGVQNEVSVKEPETSATE